MGEGNASKTLGDIARLNIVNLVLELIFYDAAVQKSKKQQEFCFACISVSPVFENTEPEGCSVKLQNGIYTHFCLKHHTS